MLHELARDFAARYYAALTAKSQLLILSTLPAYVVLAALWEYVVVLKGDERSITRALSNAFPLEDFRAVTFRTDLFCTFAAHFLTRPLIRLTVKLIVVASAAELGASLLTGLLGRPSVLMSSAAGIVAVQALAFFLSDEFSIYFIHYLQHRVPILWASHRTHHSAEALTLLTAASRLTILPLPTDLLTTIPIDFVIKAVAVGGVLHWTTPTIHPLALTLIGYIAIYTQLHEWFAHGRCSISFGWLNRIFNAPVLHQLHHSAEPQHRDKNLGGVLSIFDWMFGTLYVPSPGETWRLGIDASEIGPANPHIRIRDYVFEPYRYWWASLRRRPSPLSERSPT